MGQLGQAAKLVNRITLDKRLHEMLKEQKIGMYQTEVQCLQIVQGTRKYEQIGDFQKGKVKKKKILEIREQRKESVVINVLKIKISNLAELEKVAKKKYVEVKEEVKDEISENRKCMFKLL